MNIFKRIDQALAAHVEYMTESLYLDGRSREMLTLAKKLEVTPNEVIAMGLVAAQAGIDDKDLLAIVRDWAAKN